MKNIVAKLTLRQLKLNKRRTLITIIGIALSVTMLTATASVVTSFLDGSRRGEIASQGEWHTRLNDMPMKNVDKIKDTIPNVEDVLMLEWDGFAPIPQRGEKRFFYIESYGKNTFNHFPITLEEGRLPQKDGELIISKEAAAVGYKIGQSFTLELGYRGFQSKNAEASDSVSHLTFSDHYYYETEDRYEEKFYPTNSKTYTIVGVFSDRATYYTSLPGIDSPAYEAISFFDPATIKADTLVSPLILFNKMDTDIYSNMENGVAKLGAESYSRHSALLQYYGLSSRAGVSQAVYGFCAILVAIIMIGSVAFIYNAFNISLADRSRYLGMLACVGATKKQKRFSVMLEGIVLGAIAIPLGLLAGFGGIAVTFKFINPYLQKFTMTDVDFYLVVEPVTVIASVLLGILTIFLSLIVPMRNAAKTSPIEAVRRSNDIKIKKKQIRTSFLTKKLFGFDGMLAMKNIKRNPGRYRITVVSLVVSVVLFLTTVGAVNLAKNAFMAEIDYKENDSNVTISNGSYTGESNEDFIKVMNEIFETLSKNANTEKITSKECLYNVLGEVSSDDVCNNEVAKSALFGIKLPDGKNELMECTIVSFDERYRDSKMQSPMHNVRENEAVLINYGEKFIDYDEKTGEGKFIYDDLLKKVPNELKIWANSMADDATDEFKNADGIQKFTRTYMDLESERVEQAEYYCKAFSTVKLGAETNVMFIDGVSYGGLVIAVHPELFEKICRDYGDGAWNLRYPEISLRTDNADEACTIAEEIAQKSGVSLSIINNEDELREMESTMTLISVFSGGFIALIILICVANIFNTISTGFMLRRREFAMLKSTGMTPKAFRRMVKYESLFYAVKALLYGIPISMVIALILKLVVKNAYDTTFIALFPWGALVIAIIAILLLVGSTAFYALRKIGKDSIMDVLKDENT